MQTSHGITHIRPAREHDAAAVSALICGLGRFVTGSMSRDAAPGFFADMDEAPTRIRIASPQFRYWVAEANGAVVGVVAMRDMTHLFHLFVAEERHGGGLGRRLWDTARASVAASADATALTVNASANAAAIYRHWGFVDTGPLMQHGGIAFIPMRLML